MPRFFIFFKKVTDSEKNLHSSINSSTQIHNSMQLGKWEVMTNTTSDTLSSTNPIMPKDYSMRNI